MVIGGAGSTGPFDAVLEVPYSGRRLIIPLRFNFEGAVQCTAIGLGSCQTIHSSDKIFSCTM